MRLAVPRSGRHRMHPASKRLLDVVVASAGLVLSLPVLAAVAVAVKVESPGPVFYRAWRSGLRSAPLGVLKFRKMHADAAGPALTVRHDQRLTRIGAFLVRTHLDELPQLWNVLRGEMSLVGPRPEDPRFTALDPAAYDQILSVRPGITGCTQLVWVDERDLLTSAPDRVRLYVDELLPRKVALDRAYVAHAGFASDLKILLWTPLVLLLGWTVLVDDQNRQLRLVRRGRATPADVPAWGRREAVG